MELLLTDARGRWLLEELQMLCTTVSRSFQFEWRAADTLTLVAVPWDFQGRYSIGCFFFILNIVLFVMNVVMICLRFKFHPSTFMSSILHPTESLFIPAWLISLGTILINVTEYGVDNKHAGPWLRETMNILFWTYCGLAIFFSCGIYLTM
jgi:tellurite resistance protein TehA-like permease